MSFRGAALIAVAVMLSAGLFGVQLAAGGADFVPQRPADPCQDRERTGTDDLEALAETVVLTGLDEAACDLGVSRERLLLADRPRRTAPNSHSRFTPTSAASLERSRMACAPASTGSKSAVSYPRHRSFCRRSPTCSASQKTSSTSSPTAWSTNYRQPPTSCAGRSRRSTSTPSSRISTATNPSSQPSSTHSSKARSTRPKHHSKTHSPIRSRTSSADPRPKRGSLASPTRRVIRTPRPLGPFAQTQRRQQ
jgi:hypothetical protein